jgi:flagellum-specific peptidoglycan hydrolase FlgJ
MKKGLDELKASEFAKRLTTQDILESNWGQSSLSKDFNFGGIKDFSGNGTVKDTTEVVDGKSVKVKQPFRKFANIDEYVNYKINLVDKKWKVFGFNPDKYYSLIVSGKQKYATDPNYVSKLNKLYKLIWK